MSEPIALAERYAAVWNEPDAARRRTRIEQLWTEHAAHVLQPPQDIKDSAAAVGMVPILEIQGHDALYLRVTRSHEEFIAPGEFTFRARANAERLKDLVKFGWEMVRREDGEVAGVGLEVVFLADDGRIREDYQFIEP